MDSQNFPKTSAPCPVPKERGTPRPRTAALGLAMGLAQELALLALKNIAASTPPWSLISEVRKVHISHLTKLDLGNRRGRRQSSVSLVNIFRYYAHTHTCMHHLPCFCRGSNSPLVFQPMSDANFWEESSNNLFLLNFNWEKSTKWVRDINPHVHDIYGLEVEA